MDDMNAFERQLAREALQDVGPVRPVDDLAVFNAVVTRSPRWSVRSMFGATKLVVAGVIVALFGGFLLTSVSTPSRQESIPGGIGSPLLSPSPEATDVAAILPGVDLVTEEVEPGVIRVLGDGVRDLARPAEGPYPMLDGNIVTGLDGSAWWFAADTFFRLGDDKGYGLPDGLRPDTLLGLSDIEVGPDGRIWVVGNARDGLWTFEHGAWRTDPAFGDGTTAVEVGLDGSVWAQCCVRKGVARLDPDGWTRVDPPTAYTGTGNPVAANHYFALDQDGLPWMAVAGGLLHFDGAQWDLIDPAGAAPYRQWGQVDVGADGTLWAYFPDALDGAASREAGRQVGKAYLARLSGDTWTVYSGADGVPYFTDVWDGFEGFLEVASDGSVWLTPDGLCAGLTRFDGSRWTRFLEGRRFCIGALDAASDGPVWVQAMPLPAESRVETYVILPEATTE